MSGDVKGIRQSFVGVQSGWEHANRSAGVGMHGAKACEDGSMGGRWSRLHCSSKHSWADCTAVESINCSLTPRPRATGVALALDCSVGNMGSANRESTMLVRPPAHTRALWCKLRPTLVLGLRVGRLVLHSSGGQMPNGTHLSC